MSLSLTPFQQQYQNLKGNMNLWNTLNTVQQQLQQIQSYVNSLATGSNTYNITGGTQGSKQMVLSSGSLHVTPLVAASIGGLLLMVIDEDGTGGYQPIWDSSFFGPDVTNLRITTANTRSLFWFAGVLRGAGYVWAEVSCIQGMPIP